MKRARGLETEYGILANRNDSTNLISVRNDYQEIRGFIPNGGRLYLESRSGHLEYSTPECTSAKELLKYILAGDSLILDIAKEKNFEFLKCSNFRGILSGSHENYSLTYENRKYKKIHDLTHLAPFLITRLIWSGAGMLTEKGFSRAQRYFSGQDDEWFSMRMGERYEEKLFYRLHISGETNLSPIVNFLKFAITPMVLGLIEKNICPKIYIEESPIEIREKIGVEGAKTLLTTNFGTFNALDIQWLYYESIRKYFNCLELNEEDEKALKMLESILENLRKDEGALYGILDYVTKKEP